MKIKKGPLGPSYFHGVFVEVFEKGILLTGPSGIGKSDVALGLLDRGHYLVTDDIVFFQLDSSNKKIVGMCPSQEFKGCLEVRGLGIINIINLFGSDSVKAEASLDFICELSSAANDSRVEKEETQEDILGKAIPKFRLPTFPGRNMPLLIEAMVRVAI
jgi:HPr kinase/phosphorylase